MGTSPGVTAPARPRFGSTALGMLIKQRDSAHQLCIQCFEAMVTLFVVLNYTLLNSSSQCSTSAQQLELYRRWKWCLGRSGGDDCLPDQLLLSALVC